MFLRLAYSTTTQKFDKEVEKRVLSFDKKDFNVIIPMNISKRPDEAYFQKSAD